MKKFFAILLLSFLGTNFAKAQSVDLVFYEDSSLTVSYCYSSFLQVHFIVGATTSGYTSADAPTITIDFGDGTSTSFVDPNFSSSFPESWNFVNHTYASPGVYDVTYTVTMPDLVADSETVYGDVTVTPCEIISGYIYDDNNTNCIMDGGDVPSSFYVYAHDPGTGFYISYDLTDASGYYELLVPTGMTVDVAMSSYSTLTYVCPVSGVITTTAPSSGNDFALDCSAFDLYPGIAGGFLHPGFNSNIMFNAYNVSCGASVPASQIRVVMDNPLVTFVSGMALGGDITPTVSGDTLTWDIPAAYMNDLSLYNSMFGLYLTVNTDPSVPLGTDLCFDVIMEPQAGDANPANNLQNVCFPVLGAYDPNYIESAPHGTGAQGLVDPNLDMVYTIHFQNTGSFPATNIFIKDTINSAVLDLSTFEYLASSHTLTGLISSGDGAMVFQFDNIMLPDSTSDEPNSHGWITYRIKQQPDLPVGTTIENTAAIYFDFNAPVITNTALNTIKGASGINESSKDGLSLKIYPVPARETIVVQTGSDQEMMYNIFDMNGNVLMQGAVFNGEQISIADLANGIYFIRTENGSTQKIVVSK